ncbi:DUF2891 domain-containing protein [Neolewinella persica]|uniref:DUF2891 domain-containing protein n=1 Tax=Neolewinella persica TaxID=70998 RepID=UPI00036B9D95|nr:DUF2891 domain-containing protein [Neolewinella persica]
MRYLLFALPLLLTTCTEPASAPENETSATNPSAMTYPTPELTLAQADRLADLPLACIQHEYPNKLGQTIGSKEDLGEPSTLHPAFYGCFDWHSAVHGHWSLVALLRKFPNLKRAEQARKMLQTNLSADNINAEVAYFNGTHNKSYERTYGWAWILKLDEELLRWEDPIAKELRANLRPLSELIVARYLDFLPRLNYAIRTGEHPNTAFGLTFAYDYAEATDDATFLAEIDRTARRFYLNDQDCPISWEPGGYDFLSPCLEEIDIMRRILPANDFHPWLTDFLPAITKSDYTLPVGEVSDRSDGKLVHLDGLNFSRAWVLYGLAQQYPSQYGHLKNLANQHTNYSLPNLVGDSYEGGHWLGSFAIYALSELEN